MYPNLRRGRIDRRGLKNGSAAVFLLSMAVWLLSAEHIFGTAEFSVFWFGFATSAFYAAWFALWYCALEPFVRRLSPESLITWTRCVAGHVRDPMVGRDLLIGTLCAVLHLLVGHLGLLASAWATGERIDLRAVVPQTLDGVMGEVTIVLHVLAVAFYVSCFLTVLFVFLRHVLRYQLFAAAVFVAIEIVALAILQGLARNQSTLYIVMYSIAIGICWSINAFLVAKFGLLAYFTTWSVGVVLLFSPLTTDSSRFYFPSGLVACLFALAIAVYGFHTTLGGRSLRQWLQWSSAS